MSDNKSNIINNKENFSLEKLEEIIQNKIIEFRWQNKNSNVREKEEESTKGSTMMDTKGDAEERQTTSYTDKLLNKGEDKIAQKVGEEAVETILAAISDNQTKEELIGEAADLLYHLILLLNCKNVTLEDVVTKLQERHNKANHNNKS